MASVVIQRKKGSSERTVTVSEGGSVVASRTVSGEEFKKARKSAGSLAGTTINLGEDTLRQEDLATGMSSADSSVSVVDEFGNIKRLTPFESAVAPRVSTEEGVAIVQPQRLRTLEPVAPPDKFVRVSGVQDVEASLRAAPFDARVSQAVKEQRIKTAEKGRFIQRTSEGKLAFDFERFGSSSGQSFLQGFREIRDYGSPIAGRQEGETAIQNFFRENVAGATLIAGSQASLRGLNVVDTLALSQVPRGLTIGGLSIPKLSAGVLIASAEATAVSKGTESLLFQRAPSQFKPFFNNDLQKDVFRSSLEVERSSEPSFAKRQFSGLNIDFSKRTDVFESEARKQLELRGFKGDDLELALQAQLYRRTEIEPQRQLATTLQAGRFAEISGRTFLSTVPVTGTFSERFAKTFTPLFGAGVIEVRGELSGERQSLGSDLPFIDKEKPFKSLLPSVSLDNGLSIQSRSGLGQDIGLSFLGGSSAGFLGGLVGAGATAPKKGGLASRQLGRTANIVGNIADLSEPFTDVLASSGSQGIIVPTPSLNLKGRGVKTIEFKGTPSFQPLQPIPSEQLELGLRSNFFEVVPDSKTKPSNLLFVDSSVSRVATSDLIASSLTDIFSTPSKVSIPSTVPVAPQPLVPSFAQVPVAPQPLVPVPSVVPSFAQVPVTSFVGRIPPPVPLDLSFGGSGRGAQRRGRTSFVNELGALLSVTSAPVAAANTQLMPRGLFEEPKKKKKKKKVKSSKKPLFPDPFAELNLLSGGFRNARR